MKIISNLTGYDELFALDLPIEGEVRIIINSVLKEKEAIDKIILLKILTVGRRILNNRETVDVVKLVDGRKHRIYWAIKHKNKITVKFAWYKIKKFNDKEKKFVQENWNLDFFDNLGRKFVKQVNGVIYCETLLAKYEQLK